MNTTYHLQENIAHRGRVPIGPNRGQTISGTGKLIPWSDLSVGSHRMPCPTCGRSLRDKTLGVTIEAGAGVAHCYRCSYIETWRNRATSAQNSKVHRQPAALRKHQRLSEYGHDLWNACAGLVGTVGAAYLQARGCAIPPVEGDLRFQSAIKHPSGYVGPALVALVTDAKTCEPLTLHRTWIRADGTKADVDPPRMLLGNHRKKGGVIRLWPDDCVTYGLGIAEGIETALTLATVLKPVWSLIDAGNLMALPVLAGVEVLTIAADHDDAGIKAATVSATRWTEAGCDVRVVVPPRERADLNDFAREAA
jgi:putative DNA primase/helicase